MAIHSAGFHFRLGASQMVVPHWIDLDDRDGVLYHVARAHPTACARARTHTHTHTHTLTRSLRSRCLFSPAFVRSGRGTETCIVLTLNAKARDEVTCIAAGMSAIPPTVLLFLNQLRALTIDENIVLDDEGKDTMTSRHAMWREDLTGGIVLLHDNDETTRWRLTSRLLTCDASTPRRGDSSGATTEIAIAMQMGSPTDAGSAVYVVLKLQIVCDGSGSVVADGLLSTQSLARLLATTQVNDLAFLSCQRTAFAA